MVIAFDTLVLSRKFRHSGIYDYAQKLLTGFGELAPEYGVKIRPFVSPNGDIDTEITKSNSAYAPKQAALLRWPRLWRFGGAAISASGSDVLFCPTSSSIPFGRVPVVTTIHDATAIVMPSHKRSVVLLQRATMMAAARLSKAVLTDSQWSKDDIVRLCGVNPEKVRVVYPAYDRQIYNLEGVEPSIKASVLQKYRIDRPFILHHGAVQPRKNLVRLIEAFGRLFEKQPNLDLQLILAGPMAWLFSDIESAAQNSPVRDRIIFTGPIPLADLGVLVKSAELEVIPSLYEGFCIPMVEAMASGTATIVSKASCLPEVSGNVLEYFDPLDVEGIANTMHRVLRDAGLKKELQLAGIERAARFSWKKASSEALDVLTEVARKRTGE